MTYVLPREYIPLYDTVTTAISEGNLPKVRHSLSSHVLSECPELSCSLLITALKFGRVDIARYLLKSGAAVNGEELYIYKESCNPLSRDSQSVWSASALHLAVSRGYTDIVEMLLDRGADVNDMRGNVHTHLHLAVMADLPKDVQYDVVQCLLDRGASVNAFNFLDGRTPLHEACSRNSLAVVARLLAAGANIHSEAVSPGPFKMLFTPLHYAVNSGSVEIASYLVQRGAHVVIQDKGSPLHLAVFKANLSMIKTLMEAPFPCLPVLVNLSILSDKQNVLEYLLENGADINPTESLHPLHVAAAAGKASLCDFLLQNGACIDAKQTLTRDQVREQSRLLCNDILDLNSLSLVGLGKTALHFATENRREAVVELLLRHGADVDSTDEEGHTALQVACGMRPDPVRVVRRLLRYGADVHIIDLHQTILHESTFSLQLLSILLRHTLKLSLAGFHVKDTMQMYTWLNEAYSDPGLSAEHFIELCGKEVAKLRSENIAGINFYKIFHKSLNEMAILTRCEEVAEVFESARLNDRFPIYAKMLKARFARGENRAKLLDEVPISFHENQGFCLPYLCVKKILDYLNDGDLKRLNDACKHPAFIRIL